MSAWNASPPPCCRLASLLVLPLVSCGDEAARAPFAESRTPPSLDVRFPAPGGLGLGLCGGRRQPGAALRRLRSGRRTARSQILILPGYGESAEGWFETARDLNARGYVVWILERQGQGGSERATPWRDLGHATSFGPRRHGDQGDGQGGDPPGAGRRWRPRPVRDPGRRRRRLVALRAMEEGLRADAAILSSPNFDLADPPRAKGELIRIARLARTLKLGFVRYPGQRGLEARGSGWRWPPG
jgi:lysophospholipase